MLAVEGPLVAYDKSRRADLSGRKGTGTFVGLGASTQGDDQTDRKMSQSPAASNLSDGASRQPAADGGGALSASVHEARMERPTTVEAVFAWLDLVICLILLGEFALRISLAQDRWLYLRRNWLTGLLPVLPMGFLAYATHQLTFIVEEGELVVLLRGLRYLRLPQMARWLEAARPALCTARLVGFLIWASDRLVRRLSPLLNRNLVLFETASLEELETPYRTALTAFRERFHHRVAGLTAALAPRARCDLFARIDDLAAMLESPRLEPASADGALQVSSARDVPFEEVVARLLTITPAGISQQIGRNLAQSIARWCRAFDVFAVRRLPLVRDLVAAGRLANPFDATAQATNRLGMLFEQMLQRMYWLADLYGTITAPQLIDSLGEWMVRRTAIPTRRFLMFGGVFVVLSYLASLLPYTALHALSHFAERLVGTPLIVLGILCMVPLLVGLWFRQIANEATEFFTRVAEAQFIADTKDLKRRLARRHHAFLHRRAIAPELEESGAVRAKRQEGSIARSGPRDDDGNGDDSSPPPPSAAGPACLPEEPAFSPEEMVELLWKDYLEGAPFHRSDTRTTTQLLGNLDLLSLCYARLALSSRQRTRLRRLDLTSSRGSFRGPYLWFHFISRSLSQQTARLVVDYNAFALPLDRVATADDRQIRDHVHWLARRLHQPVAELELPSGLAERFRTLPPEFAQAEPKTRDIRRSGFQGTDFTALDFLSADPKLESAIRRRYGDQVAALVRRDRCDNIRRVFRTYPLHRLPRERRSLNPLLFYQRHLAGGWVLLFPFKLLWWYLRLTVRLVRIGSCRSPRRAAPGQGGVRRFRSTGPVCRGGAQDPPHAQAVGTRVPSAPRPVRSGVPGRVGAGRFPGSPRNGGDGLGGRSRLDCGGAQPQTILCPAGLRAT